MGMAVHGRGSPPTGGRAAAVRTRSCVLRRAAAARCGAVVVIVSARDRALFERTRLPDPLSYYTERAGLRLFGRRIWRSTRCPFHGDARPSLSVNVETGGFFCHACGVKGGDVLDFHRAKYGLSFSQAARDLGAMR